MKNIFGWFVSSIMIILILAIFFIIGLAVGINSQGLLEFASDTLSAWVAALATVCIAILTIFLAKETWTLRRIQLSQIEQIRKDSIKPSVSLFLKSSPESLNLVDVHIINNGAGTAQNIKFKFINKSNDAQDVYDDFNQRYGELVMLSNGISSLGVGEERTSYLFSFLELNQKFGDRGFEYISEIDIEFQDIEGTTYTSKSHFNLSEYKGVSEIGDGEPLHNISSTLKKIQKDIGHLTNGRKKLKSDIYTSVDREKDQERLRKARNNNK